MAQQNVVDELVVTLSLDAENYQSAEAKVERETARTYRKQQDRARGTDRSNARQQSRLKEVSAGVKAFTTDVAKAVSVVSGLGAGVLAITSGFLGFQTALTRQTVSTGLSNKEMQAWGATARRLGADADAGAQAIADFARERQQFNLTGNGPTLQAFAQMGVDVDPSRSLEDVLEQAQRVMRAAPAGQRQQYESMLSASGVSADLITMLKSETDVRAAYSRSLAQATEADTKALDGLRDALESMKAAGIQIAGTLTSALRPAIDAGAQKLGEFAVQVAEFAKDMQAAGGGVEGFQAALDENTPKLGRFFEGLRLEFQLLTEASSVVRRGFRDWGDLLGPLLTKVAGWFGYDPGQDDASGTRLSTGQRAALAVSDWWSGLVSDSRKENAAADAANARKTPANPSGLPASIDPADVAMNAGQGASGTSQQLMALLTGKYGLSVAQAAAVTANWQAESGLRASAVNPAGGGQGARGLAQWRGERIKAFVARYGVTPDKATMAQQVEFAMTDPYEQRLMRKAFEGGGSAEQLGLRFSRHYEAHGNAVEDAARAKAAGKLASGYAPAAGASAERGGATINIQNLNLAANNPGEMANSLQRIDSTQAYNTVVR